jgi:hypothetical protein
VNPIARLTAFAAVLLLALAAGAAVGSAVGPIDVGGDEPSHQTDADHSDDDGPHAP